MWHMLVFIHLQLICRTCLIAKHHNIHSADWNVRFKLHTFFSSSSLFFFCHWTRKICTKLSHSRLNGNHVKRLSQPSLALDEGATSNQKCIVRVDYDYYSQYICPFYDHYQCIHMHYMFHKSPRIAHNRWTSCIAHSGIKYNIQWFRVDQWRWCAMLHLVKTDILLASVPAFRYVTPIIDVAWNIYEWMAKLSSTSSVCSFFQLPAHTIRQFVRNDEYYFSLMWAATKIYFLFLPHTRKKNLKHWEKFRAFLYQKQNIGWWFGWAIGAPGIPRLYIT